MSLSTILRRILKPSLPPFLGAKPTKQPNSLPDPEELPADAQSFPAGVVMFALIAYFFSSELPYWKPLTWWLLVTGFGVLRVWVIRRTQFDKLTEKERCWRLRVLIWMFMAAMSSATYFLYVPGDIAMQSLLAIFLLGNATILIASLTGVDWMRTFVALLILGIPNAIHLIFDGITMDQRVLLALGCCGLIVPIPFAQISAVQSRLMRKQFESRLQAEGAAKAMSSVALAKSRFFAAISHDLRQPVHAIGLYLDAIERVVTESGNKQARNAVTGITVSWQTLNDLLSKVLDLARLEANMEKPDLYPLCLASLIQEVVLQHSSIAERNGVRLIALTKPNCWVYADELMLKRVLSNLLGNAIKFAPPGSTVALAVRRSRNQWRVQVRDAGCGIAEADQALIFSEFVQINNHARDPSQGLGLGLAIAKRLTELLGGTISVRSRAGAGCCMTVALERYAPASAPLPVTPANVAPKNDFFNVDTTAMKGLRVLLVEDDVLVGGAMLQLLQSWGSRVHWEQTAVAARRYTSKYDIAICDVRLPGNESGLTLATGLQATGKRVLLITGETDSESRDYATQHNIQLLTKPVSPRELKSALESLTNSPQ